MGLCFFVFHYFIVDLSFFPLSLSFSLSLSLSLSPSLCLSTWPDPRFIAAHVVPDSDDRDDDKVYFFFTEKAMESGDREGAIHTRVGRVCAVRRRGRVV